MARASERRAEIERWLRLSDARDLTLREIAKRSVIPSGTLSWWARQRGRSAAPAPFVAVRVCGEAAKPASSASVSPVARLRLPSGVAVTLSGEHAKRLTEALLTAMR